MGILLDREGELAIKQLPVDANEISGDYTSQLKTPLLYKPLKRFLRELTDIPALEAIAISIYNQSSRVPHSLEFYAVVDGGGLFEQGSPTSLAAVELSKVHGVLWRALWGTTFLSPHLSFVNWDNQRDLSKLIPYITEGLVTDPIFGDSHLAEGLSHWTVAKITN